MMASDMREFELEPSWLKVLGGEFDCDYMIKLSQFLLEEKAKAKVIYPPSDQIFSAFNSTPFDQVKVVILGQDPYHGSGQAHGLCFSVKPDVKIPPSLQNIFKEVELDLGISRSGHGCLTYWAEQGVLLLNSVLSVEQGKAASHQGKGWERFTDKAIEVLNSERKGLVFLLWGNYAHKKGALIDRKKHLVLQSPHPSPLSAHRGFFGNNHFSSANDYLMKQGKTVIDWVLPSIE